ncbi:membrane protein [Bombiscardovia apis]|uniref:Membrane protein n=1 Tax=Bombiscardovia apis TaxID=2932182 RepID=A0ABM8BEM5_9BIFI|nr:type II secretion system F family protein [Bombiscardovia apis]BDR55350.1 membrane protein [Bombiscardovia apis]
MLGLLAAVLAGCALYLWLPKPVRSLETIDASADLPDIALTLLLEMVAVCVRQGASIPRALDQIGAACSSDISAPLSQVARLLNQGSDWYSAWSQACSHERYGGQLKAVRDCLEPSWRHGISPLGRIETTIEQLDQGQRRSLNEASARLTVKILLPTGLCILPAFIVIGVVPCIAAFAGGLSL